MKSANQRIPQLDGIRGLAIGLVMIGHFFIYPLTSGAVLGYIAIGVGIISVTGVDLFFVLSGFLIGGILLDNRAATNYFKVFYVRRFYRILPVYFAWLALFFICARLLPGNGLFTSTIPGWSYLSFTQNFVMAQIAGFGAAWLTTTWSLAIEEQFYLTAPLLIRLLSYKRLVVLLCLLILLSPIVRLIVSSPIAVYVLTYCRLDGLAWGILCALAVRHKQVSNWLTAHVSWLYAAVATLPLGLLLQPARLVGHWSVLSYSFYSLAYAGFLLLAVTAPQSPLARLTMLRPLQEMGILAYGLYLFHYGLNNLAHRLLVGHSPRVDSIAGLAVTILVAGVTFSIAYLSWHHFETPFVRLGHRHSYEENKQEASVLSFDSASVG